MLVNHFAARVETLISAQRCVSYAPFPRYAAVKTVKRFPEAPFEGYLTGTRARAKMRRGMVPLGAFLMSTSTELSPYEVAASAAVYSRAIHFHGAAEIWVAFANKKISSAQRESLLRHLRDRLALIPLEK